MEKNDDSIIKKSFISGIIFILIVIVVFYFIFRENNYKEIYSIYKSANGWYLLIALFCMACFSVCEALNLKATLDILKEKVSFKKCYKYSISGYFVAGITPSATGGDPVQLYMMAKDKIKIANGTLALLLKLLAYQFSIFFLGLIGFIICHKTFLESLGDFKYVIIVGAFLNILVGTLYFSIIFFKGIIDYLLRLLSAFLHKLHIKSSDKIIEKIKSGIDEYSKASNIIKQNKIILVRLFLTAIIQMILFNSIPYFVYLALGLNTNTIITFLSLQAVLYISVSSLPFPGSVGISEATFMKVYRKLFPQKFLGSAMIITRFINFYIFIIYSGILVIYFLIKDMKKR